MMPIGMPSRSKKGAPTRISRSSSTCTINGKTVPSRTTNANRAKITLLARNAPSRESGESIVPGERRRSPRQAINANDTTTTTPKKPSRYGPMALSLNACTLFRTPERVRNVPRIVRLNVAISNERFQTRSMPRRSWTSTECR